MGVATLVAKKKTQKVANVEIRAEEEWVARVDAEAARLGLKRSAYIRMVVTREMDRAEAERRRDGIR